MNKNSNLNQDNVYERVLLVKPTVYVYRIPPLTSASQGFRASDWNLAEPDWTGRIRVITKNDECFIYIEDATTGELYAKAPILTYPGPQFQPVSDSSRYFIARVVSDTGRSALIGIGFADGADAFDLNVVFQDHFIGLKHAAQDKVDEQNLERPKLDLALKGDIKVKLNFKDGGSTATSKPPKPQNGIPWAQQQADSSVPFLLPPPPPSSARSRK